MTKARRRNAKHRLVAIAIALGLLTLAPISSSFVVFSSTASLQAPRHGGTTVITKNAPMPEWIAAIVQQNTEVNAAQNDQPIADDSDLI